MSQIKSKERGEELELRDSLAVRGLYPTTENNTKYSTLINPEQERIQLEKLVNLLLETFWKSGRDLLELIGCCSMIESLASVSKPWLDPQSFRNIK